jgi:predicted dehydrogenase
MTIEASSSTTAGRRLRLGMVGGGRGAFIGAVHRIAARLDDRYELVAGALSSDADRARASAADLHIAPDRAYADFAAMAQAEAARPDGIDVVAIVTPNHLHAPTATAFLKAGINVICDKPMTRTVAEAEALAALVADTGLNFVLTHNYTGYPMVRQARSMVAAGELGTIRLVQVEYPQDWLTVAAETMGSKQAEWRTDPDRAGAAGSVGDIGSHAMQLAEYVSGLECEALAADLTTFVPGRRLDDNAGMLLRFAGGARGMLWCSQVAPGNANALRLRIYGDRGGLEWTQENPNELYVSPFGEPTRKVIRSGPGANPQAAHASRVPGGHPEGYLEAFAQIYTDAAELITARIEKRSANPAATAVPTVKDGVRGVRFINAAVASSRDNGAWTRLLDV